MYGAEESNEVEERSKRQGNEMKANLKRERGLKRGGETHTGLYVSLNKAWFCRCILQATFQVRRMSTFIGPPPGDGVPGVPELDGGGLIGTSFLHILHIPLNPTWSTNATSSS